MANIFKEMMNVIVPSNKFDLSHDVKMTFDMGELVPLTVIPTMPGDYFTFNTETFLRFAPLLSPVMHDIDVCVDWYYAPCRIMWSEFEEWIIGNSASAAPYGLVDSATNAGDLGDYLGLPVDTGAGHNVSAYPGAMYAWICDYGS